ncbi:hypothetical protein BN931_303 [Bifidobacterium animalis subsp. lactis CECT 8145]|nr:hypothetical protein W91_1298 [Bifidobacterium animalis subsp. lactis Bi-07]AJD34381.1 hypothetical protein BAA6_1268 [Bifidobacterium animalis]QIR81301.1 hypothetical protein M8PIadj_1287 [Bifidobacterium animalis]CDL71116.1 hypothetical protein BN931_303 [Bifidobacterium animalis subsp. lactis CECT 8145]
MSRTRYSFGHLLSPYRTADSPPIAFSGDGIFTTCLVHELR